MQPDLVLTEEQRKERFSESLNRKKMKTEHASLVCLPGSQTMEKNSRLESLVTNEHLGVKDYKSSVVPEKVSVIIKRPTTNNRVTIHYDENDTFENNNTGNGNYDEQCIKNVTSEPPLIYLTSPEDGQHIEMSEENQIHKMTFPQNPYQNPPQDSICETMETFFENTNDEYIDINFAELTDERENPSTSKFNQDNLEKEDNMEYEATSNASSKQQQSSVTSEDSEETKRILKYVLKQFCQIEQKKQKYSESNSDSSLKDNQSIENR